MNKNTNTGFCGLRLSPKQRKDTKLYMKSELGEENYDLVENFFNFVADSEAKYKVIPSRECFNLLNLFYRCNHGSPVSEIEDKVVSGNALFAYIPEIASEYLQWGFFPEILIADDILIHGRAINSLLDSFVQSVYSYILDKGANKGYQDIESDILKSTNIITIAQSDNTLLMKPAYYQRLFTSGYEFHVLESVKWHDLSLRIARLNCEGPFSSTVQTLSLYEQKADSHLNDYVATTALNHGFAKSEWNKRNVRDMWVKPLADATGDIFAFYTVLAEQPLKSGRWHITPYVILPDLDVSSCISLFKKVFSQDVSDALTLLASAEGPCAELLCLTLNYNLLLLLVQDDPRITVSKTALDLDKIMLHYGKNSVFEATINELLAYTTPFLNWDELADFILTGSAQQGPIMPLFPERSQLPHLTLEELLIEEGESAEIEASQEYTGQKYVPKLQTKQPISNLFKRIAHATESLSSQELADLVADVLRHTGQSALSLEAEHRHEDQGYFTCTYRSGNQAQFIRPGEYADYLPVLLEIEKDCNNNCKEIIHRIEQFYDKDPKLKDKLIDFVNYLYRSDQRLRDWDIDWLHCTEVTDEIQQASENKSQQEIIASLMVIRIMRRHNELNKYRNMFPQPFWEGKL